MLPLGCQTQEVRRGKAPMAKAVLGVPERPGYHNTAPPQCCTHTPAPSPNTCSPSKGLRRAGEGHGCAAHTSPRGRAGPPSPPQAFCQKIPSLSTKKCRLGVAVRLRDDTSASPKGHGGSGEPPPPLPTVHPARQGEEGFYGARGLLLTKVEAVIGRVGPPPLLRAVAGHGAEAAPQRPPPPPRR